MTNNIEKQSFGQAGAVLLTSGGTSSATGDFCAIQVLDDAVVTLTWPELTGTFSSISLTAGTIIYGQITTASVSSGTILCYKQVR